MILNLTQHPSTPEQRAAGVFDLPPQYAATLAALLTFDALPTPAEVSARAFTLASIADAVFAEHDGRGAAMIGGAPYLMAPLQSALAEVGIDALYAFSVRESVERVLSDGSVQKTAVFRHAGFVQTAEAR